MVMAIFPPPVGKSAGDQAKPDGRVASV